jgi:hypothetical protein
MPDEVAVADARVDGEERDARHVRQAAAGEQHETGGRYALQHGSIATTHSHPMTR